LLCGVAPVWSASLPLTGGLQERRGKHYSRGISLQRFLVSGQVAICFILLTAAAVLVLTFVRARLADPGFDVSHTISIEVRLRRANANAFFALREALNTISGVEAVSSDQGFAPPIAFLEHIRRADEPREAEVLADVTGVGPRYFGTMQIPIERGRD